MHVDMCCAVPRLGRGDRPGRRETSAVMPKLSLLSQNPRSASIACCGSTTRVTSRLNSNDHDSKFDGGDDDDDDDGMVEELKMNYDYDDFSPFPNFSQHA